MTKKHHSEMPSLQAPSLMDNVGRSPFAEPSCENYNEYAGHVRLLWQLGDWHALCQLSRQIDIDAATAELAVYFAVAYAQLGGAVQAKSWAEKSLSSGVSKKFFLACFLSGVHSSLGNAYLCCSDPNHEAAFESFQSAAKLAVIDMPEALINARIRQEFYKNEKNHGLISGFDYKQSVRALFAQDESDLVNIKVLLDRYYSINENVGVWYKTGSADFNYSDGDEVESRLLSAVINAKDTSLYSVELLEQQTDWPSVYHLSADRVNLLRPFAKSLSGASVLELGCGCGAITRYLGELGTNVIAVEGSPRRAEIAAARCRDLNNVTVVVDRLQDVPLEGSFDVVTLIGVLEYSRVYVESTDPIGKVLQCARRYLKPGGKLIVAIENQLGLKYFAGAPEDHGVGVMSGINDIYTESSPVTFGHTELVGYLTKAGFVDVETFLPFPDYKLPSLIVHPMGQKPRADFDLATLLRGATLVERQPIQQPLFSLEQAWPLVERNGLLRDLANSHVLVASTTHGSTLAEPSVLASYYTPKRAASYSQQLDFIVEPKKRIQSSYTKKHDICDEQIVVRRKELSDTQKTFQDNDLKIETYIQGDVHADLLNKIVQSKSWKLESLVDWCFTWVEALRRALVIPNKTANELGWGYEEWLPGHFIDAIPRNLLIKPDGVSVFIDLEWSEPYSLPLLLVVYRGLWVTFSGLTSVEEPENESLLNVDQLINFLLEEMGLHALSEKDYERFLPIIDGLIAKSQGASPPDPPRTQPYLAQTLKVRGETNIPTSKLILYWRANENGYNEKSTVSYNVFMDGRAVELTLKLPEIDSMNGLRLDVVNRPAYVFIHSLSLFDIMSNKLWEWDFCSEKLEDVVSMSFFDIPGESYVGALCSGDDPHFQLPLSDQEISRISGGSVRIKFHAFLKKDVS